MVKQRQTHHVQYLNVKIVVDSLGAGDRKSTGGLPRGQAARHTHHEQYINVKIVVDSLGAGDRKSTGGLPRGQAAPNPPCAVPKC